MRCFELIAQPRVLIAPTLRVRAIKISDAPLLGQKSFADKSAPTR